MKKVYIAFAALICLLMINTKALAAGAESISASGTTATIDVSGSVDDGIYAVVVQIRDAGGNVINMESTGVDSSNSFSISMSGLSLTAGIEYDVYVADYNGGEWLSTKVTPKAVVNEPSGGGSTDTEKKEETITEEKSSESSEETKSEGKSSSSEAVAKTSEAATTLVPETKETATNKPVPKITELEPTVKEDESLTIPVENIEADLPGSISEKAKEELAEQVAQTVSELIDSILSGDENVGRAVSTETLENIKAALADNKTIIAVVTATVVDEKSIPSEDKTSIDEVLSKEKESNMEVACYLDLSIMLKTTDGDELGTYDELTKMVTFTIESPKDMPCPEGKEYVVIRIHNGESSILPVTVNADGTLSFETNEFSTYALALKDKEEVIETLTEKKEDQTIGKALETAPKTPEESETEKSKTWIFVIIALVVIVGGVALFFAVKRRDE